MPPPAPAGFATVGEFQLTRLVCLNRLDVINKVINYLRLACSKDISCYDVVLESPLSQGSVTGRDRCSLPEF